MGRKDRRNPQRGGPSTVGAKSAGSRVPAAPAVSAEPPAPDAPPPSPSARKRVVLRLRIAAALVALWIAALAALAWFTANPVTFNLDQLRHAQLIVTAVVVSRTEGTVNVSKVWKGDPGVPTGPSRLDNLSRTEARNGRECLIPITRRPDGTLLITETRLPNGRPLIYPATPEAMEALSTLLNQETERSRDRGTER